eukprot:3762284-Alexandrium_andersonii.AAC.1
MAGAALRDFAPGRQLTRGISSPSQQGFRLRRAGALRTSPGFAETSPSGAASMRLRTSSLGNDVAQ